ncbi:MAG: hypothetical protein HGA22_06235 [Clostridiales bacterium]|nr:hypothetical protein [Clostridiales bacterium]
MKNAGEYFKNGGKKLKMPPGPPPGPNGMPPPPGPNGMPPPPGPNGMPPPPGPNGMPMMGGADIDKAAIYIENGRYDSGKSVERAVYGEASGNASAEGVWISSAEEGLNGLYVKGKKSIFCLGDSKIKLDGNGANDFNGIGAAVMSHDGATLVMKNVMVETNGCVRPAAMTTDNSTLRAYDCCFTVHDGTLPDGYVPFIGPGMLEVPAPLGITGNCRACLTTDNSESYYHNCSISADAWGALSTDMGGGYTYLEANNCEVKVIRSGYGTYADGNGCRVSINDSRFEVATFAGIIAGDGEIKFSNTDVKSGENHTMIHNVSQNAAEIADLLIKGGKIETGESCLLIKSANVDIVIDGAEIKPLNGVLIESAVNSDSKSPQVNGKVSGIRVMLLNMALSGDVIHRLEDRTMALTLSGTDLKGAVRGASIKLEDGSRWLATSSSEVTLEGVTDISGIDALADIIITAAAGEGCTLVGSSRLASGGMLNIK